ncbi:uncharacterized protein LOC135107514 isoform X1 [Scylla paramamosain]|uniref:uncharacterized protein LOC135107514 isoform X1 n=1 Tax=Scylla paramamosain TaxID=85552 RepID=UPI0030838395
MTVVSVVRYGVILWTVLEVAGTSQSSKEKTFVAGTREPSPSVEDDTNNLYLPSSQQSTGSLPAWAVSAGVAVALPSTHSLTGLPWWTSLPATPAIRLDEERRVQDSSLSVRHYLASRNSPPSVSLTSIPHVLPLPLSPHHKPSSPGLAKGSSLLQSLHSSNSPRPSFGNENKDKKKSYNNEENLLQNVQMKNEIVPSERRRRASVGTYDIPVSVVSYSPTSHFFMHELLDPQLGRKSILESPRYFTRNRQIPSSSSAPIVFPGPTVVASTTTPPPHIVYPTESTFPSTVSHNVTLPSKTTDQGLQDQGLSSTAATPPDPGVTDNRVIIVVPCRGLCKISAGRVCVTDQNCLTRQHGK